MNSFKRVLTLLLISNALAQAMDEDKKKAQEQKPVLTMADRALLTAASLGSVRAAGIALRWGARINAQDGDGHTALHKAVIKAYQNNPKRVQQFNENPGLVQLLMQAGADCTIENYNGVSVLEAIAHQGDSVSARIVPYILRAMHHCKVLAHDSQEALVRITYYAARSAICARGQTRELSYYLLRDSLRAGADIVRLSPDYGTIYQFADQLGDQYVKDLITAFQKEHSERVKLVLHSGSLNQPLLHASLYPIIFECLYAQPQEGVMTGYCKDLLTMPIRTEVEANDVLEKLKRFRSVDGDVWFAKDSKGNTALHLAVMQGNMPIIECIGGFVLSPDKTIYLYQLASQYGHIQIVQSYLKRIEEDLSCAVSTGDDMYVLKLANAHLPISMYTGEIMREAIKFLKTALHPAIYKQVNVDKALEVLKILCAAGADLTVVDPSDSAETYLELAVRKKLANVIKLLLYLGVDASRPNSQTREIPWEQTDDPEIKALLKNPKETLENLTDDEKKEFADIKAEREKRLAAYKATNNNFAAAAAGAGKGAHH